MEFLSKSKMSVLGSWQITVPFGYGVKGFCNSGAQHGARTLSSRISYSSDWKSGCLILIQFPPGIVKMDSITGEIRESGPTHPEYNTDWKEIYALLAACSTWDKEVDAWDQSLHYCLLPQYGSRRVCEVTYVRVPTCDGRAKRLLLYVCRKQLYTVLPFMSQSGVFLTLSLAVCPIFVCRFSECWHYKHTCTIIPNTCQHIEQARKAAYASALSSIGLCFRPWTHCSAILLYFFSARTVFMRFGYSGECCRELTEAVAVDVAGQGYLSPWLAWDCL